MSTENASIPSPSIPVSRSLENRSRASEFYGFVALTCTYLFFVVYVLWAVLPDSCIEWIGVTWYPNREWALLIPAWTIVTILLTYVVYSAIAIAATPSFDDMTTITDARANLPVRSSGREKHNPYFNSTQSGAIPELYDIPIGMVNRVIYQRRRSLEKA